MEPLVLTFRLGSYTVPESATFVTLKVNVPEFLVPLDVKVTLPAESVLAVEFPLDTTPLQKPVTETFERGVPVASVIVTVALAVLCPVPDTVRDMLISATNMIFVPSCCTLIVTELAAWAAMLSVTVRTAL